jgi:hypothetical protein
MRIVIRSFLVLSFLLSCGQTKVEKKDSIAPIAKTAKQLISEVRDFQDDLNMNYADPDKSPLLEKDRENFKGLQFFEIDTTYYIEANFVPTPDSAPFKMPTTTEREPWYKKLGEAHFVLNEKEFVLNVYQSIALSQTEEYEDYLFLPYTDLSNGEGSYTGGRYMDVEQPIGDKIYLDFNKSYNPYCAYNGKYSCPIPPSENHLNTPILAGVKAYDKK